MSHGMGCRRLFPVKTEFWIAVVILVPLLISFIVKQRKIPLLHESKNSSNHRQFAHLSIKYLRMSARETTGFKSLVTFDFCKNYKQQCMFSYLQESNVLPHLQEFEQKCRQPCKTTMESRLSRDVTKTGWSASWSKVQKKNVIYFEYVQHEEANGRNVHVEIILAKWWKLH